MGASLWRRAVAWWLTLRAASYRHFGNLYGDRDAYDSAIGDLTYAIHLDPGRVEAYVMRGTLYWRELNEPARAVRDFDLALRLDATRWDALLNRGLAYQVAGDWERALADLRRYVTDAPGGSWKITAENLCQHLEHLLTERRQAVAGQEQQEYDLERERDS
jgi:tetratricopeptide (TPR) repeat protein